MFRFTALLLVLISNAALSQFAYKNLMLEGAGIRGIAYAGALSELEQKGHLDSIKRVGGTSAGAIVALTISLGYTSKEISDIVYSTNFDKFNDGRYFFVGGIHRVQKYFGWYRGDEFVNWLGELIKNKTGSTDITFEEMHQLGYRGLYITATSLNRQKLLIFSHETYPKMKVKYAVRASMSIPLYFEALYIDSVGNVIENPKETKDLDLLVDGGITGNFPIFIFDSTSIVSHRLIRCPNLETLGVRIETEEQIAYDETSRELAPIEINNIKDYAVAMYAYTKENLNRNLMIPEDWERTISISSVGIGPKVRQLTDTQKNALITSGVNSTREFLIKHKL